MFKAEVYTKRRELLRESVTGGLALFLGNIDTPMNYPANPYHFRQDSDFLYFFGLDLQGLAGLIDLDTGKDYIFGNDVDVDDIIWMGPQPSIKELALLAGVEDTYPMAKLEDMITDSLKTGRRIHFLPPYRGETKITLATLLKENPCQMKSKASVDLIKSVIALRSIKEDYEIKEIEKAVNIAYDMHTTAMRMCKPGMKEQEIFGAMEGMALSQGKGPSFPIILSINGQTLHNHAHNNILREGRMMVADAGAETNLNYSSDITRTTPVGGKFNQQQKEIYEIVLKANADAINSAAPGMSNKDLHMMSCRLIATGLKELGLMKGSVDEAVAAGAHALFMPHGLGHMMGIDVHDMEGLGENYVGYNDRVKRSDQFGLAYLRFALPYKAGHVFTIEPGCYFIPELIDKWKSEQKHTEFINYDNVEHYRGFGGIRIEDDLLITEKGHQLLGKPIPKTVVEVETTCAS
ncbi:MAG TPA: aminopeptidase P family protein [Bacteroidales bacterium]|nr:aminopeptidase P family protein [Bacteroidales bacterium]